VLAGDCRPRDPVNRVPPCDFARCACCRLRASDDPLSLSSVGERGASGAGGGGAGAEGDDPHIVMFLNLTDGILAFYA